MFIDYKVKPCMEVNSDHVLKNIQIKKKILTSEEIVKAVISQRWTSRLWNCIIRIETDMSQRCNSTDKEIICLNCIHKSSIFRSQRVLVHWRKELPSSRIKSRDSNNSQDVISKSQSTVTKEQFHTFQSYVDHSTMIVLPGQLSRMSEHLRMALTFSIMSNTVQLEIESFVKVNSPKLCPTQ